MRYNKHRYHHRPRFKKESKTKKFFKVLGRGYAEAKEGLKAGVKEIKPIFKKQNLIRADRFMKGAKKELGEVMGKEEYRPQERPIKTIIKKIYIHQKPKHIMPIQRSDPLDIFGPSKKKGGSYMDALDI